MIFFSETCSSPPRVLYEDVFSTFFPASNALTQSNPELLAQLPVVPGSPDFYASNYWLAIADGKFVLDFGCQKAFNLIQLGEYMHIFGSS